MKHNPTVMIKCTFSNEVHKLLNPNPVKNRDKWRTKKVDLTDKQKIELFDMICQLDKISTEKLGKYWYERRNKKRIQKKRNERGFIPKKKTTKEEYLKNLVLNK